MSLLRKWRKPEHQWVEESLSAYLDGELSPAEKTRVEQHLQECQACTENLATLRQTVSLLKELPAKSAPRSFAIRPVAVTAKRAAAPPAWGYGLLKGATALAALLLVLLVGGDLAIHFVSAPLPSWGPAAPAEEVAMAPALEPSMAPAPDEERAILGQDKAEEPTPPAPPPTNQEEAAAPLGATDEYETEGAMPTVEARAEDAAAAGTPVAPVPSGQEPLLEEEGVGTGAAETPSAAPTTAAVSATPGDRSEPTPPPAPESAPTEATEEHDAVPSPTPTPQVLAMAEVPPSEGEVQEFGGEQPEEQALPFSALRLAELAALSVLALLGTATVVSAWLRRRSG
jgi:hypothetical protein